MRTNKAEQVTDIVMANIRQRGKISHQVADAAKEYKEHYCGLEPTDEDYERWTIGYLRAAGHQQIDRAYVLKLVAIAKAQL